ncbi:MAG TPA: OsmC family protein [Chloroflexota bacterium]|nr:OsmC family protein [Chloroflexota bacterium]
MAQQYPVSTVRAYSSNVYGRCITNVGDHHFVVDHATYQDGPGDQPGPTEIFLSGVASCGVLLVEREAKNRRVRLDSLEVTIDGHRSPARPDREHTTFDRVAMRFAFVGPGEEDAGALVAHYRRT